MKARAAPSSAFRALRVLVLSALCLSSAQADDGLRLRLAQLPGAASNNAPAGQSTSGASSQTAPAAAAEPTPAPKPAAPGAEPAAPQPPASVPAVPTAPAASSSASSAAPASVPAAPAERVGPASPASPATDRGPIVRPPVQAGDRWTYRQSSGAASGITRQTIRQVSEDGISLVSQALNSFDSQTAIYSRQWGLIASGFNDYNPPLAYYSFPLYPGKRWGIDSTVSNFGAGQKSRIKGEARVEGWEEVQTQLGSFLALKIEIDMETSDPGDANRILKIRETHWYSRLVMRPVRVESRTELGGQPVSQETVQLLEFRLE
jgi:hypothetical protein